MPLKRSKYFQTAAAPPQQTFTPKRQRRKFSAAYKAKDASKEVKARKVTSRGQRRCSAAEVAAGKEVEVFFDDGKWYKGVVRGADKEGKWEVEFADDVVAPDDTDVREVSVGDDSLAEAEKHLAQLNEAEFDIEGGFHLFVCTHPQCGKCRVVLKTEIPFLTSEERDARKFQCHMLAQVNCDVNCDCCAQDICECPEPKHNAMKRAIKEASLQLKSKEGDPSYDGINALRGRSDGQTGMYRIWRKTLNRNQEIASAQLSRVFPGMAQSALKEVVLFAEIIKRRGSEVAPSEDTRERRKRDFDVVQREQQKWFTARGRFQAIMAKTEKNPQGFLDEQQWGCFIEATRPYKHQYFKVFTSLVYCCGPWDTDCLEPYRTTSDANPTQTFCEATIDFLYASEEDRKQWTLDHQIEAHVVVNYMRECKAQGKPLNFKFCAHLLFGLEASAEFGAPNLRPRCAKCDTTKRHRLEVPSSPFVPFKAVDFTTC